MPVEFISIAGKILPGFNARLKPLPVELEISSRNKTTDAEIISYFKDIVKQYPDLAITEPTIEGNKIHFNIATMLPEPFTNYDAEFMLKEYTGMYERKFILANKPVPEFTRGIVESNMIEDLRHPQAKVPRYFSSELVGNVNIENELLGKTNDTDSGYVANLSKYIGEILDEPKSSDFKEHHINQLKGKEMSPEQIDIFPNLPLLNDVEKYEDAFREYRNIVNLERQDKASIVYELLALWHIALGDKDRASAFHKLASNHFKEK